MSSILDKVSQEGRVGFYVECGGRTIEVSDAARLQRLHSALVAYTPLLLRRRGRR